MKEEAADNDKVMQAQETDWELELESVVGGADPPIITQGGG